MINVLTSNQLSFGKVDVTLNPVQFPALDVKNSVIITNASGATVYLGNSSVNIASGFPIAVGSTLITPFENLSMLYAVCQSGFTSDVRFLIA